MLEDLLRNMSQLNRKATWYLVRLELSHITYRQAWLVTPDEEIMQI